MLKEIQNPGKKKKPSSHRCEFQALLIKQMMQHWFLFEEAYLSWFMLCSLVRVFSIVFNILFVFNKNI